MRPFVLRLRFVLLTACLLPAPARADELKELKGKVVLVSEGDTLTLTVNEAPVTIRLRTADAPEPGQPYADKARELTARLCLGKIVSATTSTADLQGRKLGRICLAPRCLDEELIAAGLAWHNKSNDSSSELAALEQAARKAKRGLWADARPVSPWEWRRAHPNPPLQATARPAPGAIDVTHPVCGDPKTRLAHWFSCEAAKGLSCKLTSPSAAGLAGFKPHTCLTARSASPSEGSSSGSGSSGSGDADTCHKDRDCVFKPRPACGCPPCGEQQRQAVSRQEARRLARERAAERRRCPKVKCAKCETPLRWLGKRAVCNKGQCEVR